MRWRKSKINSDEAFHSFIKEADPAAAERLFSEVCLEMTALVERIVGVKWLVQPVAATSREDVAHDIGVRVIELLRQTKEGLPTEPIENFTAYVSTLTYREYDRISKSNAAKLAFLIDADDDDDDATSIYESLVDQASSPEQQVIIKEYLQHELDGIRRLPEDQAAVWLLHTTDKQGDEMVSLFIHYGICAPVELATLMGCADEKQLAHLLDHFPQSAADIGRLMSLPAEEVYIKVRLAKGRLRTHRKKLQLHVPK